MKTMNIVISTTALAVLFASCSTNTDTTQVSSGTLTFEGIAATGYAMTGATVSIKNANGEELYSGITNELGAYKASIENEGIEMPLSIQAQAGDTQFENILVSLPESANQEAVVAHLNPITDLGAKALREQAENMKSWNVKTCDSLRNARIESLLGEGIQYESFASNKQYTAAVEGNEAITPSAEDMLLHTLGERANASGESIQQYLEVQSQKGAHLLTEDAAFQSEYTVQMQNFGMDSTHIQEGIRTMLTTEQGDSLAEKINQIGDQYKGLSIPDSCSNAEIQAQIQNVVSLQTQLSADNQNTELQAQLSLATKTLETSMTQAQQQCQVQFEIPEMPNANTEPSTGSDSPQSEETPKAETTGSDTGSSSSSSAPTESGK